MNEAEKERLIKKDIKSIENRVRSAFNQGYEMGLKEGRSKILNTYGDAISRQAALDLAKDLTFEGGCKHRCVDVLDIEELPPVTPQQKPIDKSAMMYEIYMNGVNMSGEYQGCWVRFKDIEKIVDEYMAESEAKS